MKKIMFNDKYGLTQAVLDRTKTMTRRLSPKKTTRLTYNVGDIVAIAQDYHDVFNSEYSPLGESDAGIFNKMFVKAKYMPHHIKIKSVRTEHLQDISDEDCLKEGIYSQNPDPTNPKFIGYSYDATINPHKKRWWFQSPREAFAALIDKVSGKGTWDRNPLVLAYEFELID